jgi:uncharacterized protein (DUF1697 family)
MPRYVAFLRGVMPTNAKMPQLRKAFERAGFTNVKTVLGSGNVVFDARATSETALAKRAESAMAKYGKSFPTIVRSTRALQRMLDADPFARFRLPPKAKRVVTFVRKPSRMKLPIEKQGARILAMTKGEVFSAYVPHPRTPVFMTLIAKTLGKDVTTRTWDTVMKCAAA